MAAVLSSAQQAWLAGIQPYATAAANSLGDSTAEVAGQWALESGYGTNTDSQYNNPGSIMVPGTQTAQKYANLGDFTSAYIAVEKSDNATNLALNPQGFAEANASYDSTNPNYSQSVLNTGLAVAPYLSSNPLDPASASQFALNTVPALNNDGYAASKFPVNSSASPSSGCTAPGLDPATWVQFLACEKYNFLVAGLGILVLAYIFRDQITGLAVAAAA